MSKSALSRLLRNTSVLATIIAAIPPAYAQTSDVAPAPQDESGRPADIIVTAQRREQAIQDVPIAISAFSQESLNTQKVEGGSDLLKVVPNVTFSKNNFAGYNLSIRGVGTKAVSVSTDPGIAVNFNSTTLITNRFFEQEFYDLERVEVLRGPQGTLYGRNATGGVVNLLSNKPDLTQFDGNVKLEGGNFDTRRGQAMINVPIIGDVLGVRGAASFTKRDGFTRNELTGNRIDGRDLYSTRATVSFAPASTFRADFIWEHFSEDDNRSRTAKQLCHRDDGPESIGGITLSPIARGVLSQGCKAGSLYDDAAFGVPNGLSLPYVILAQDPFFGRIGFRLTPDGGVTFESLLKPGVDPYADTTQSRDLRSISSIADPIYRAKANVYQLNATWDVSDTLSLTSQTTYNKDRYYSSQDYNRFNTVPIFNDSSGLLESFGDPTPTPNVVPGGVYTDPQLGPSSRLVAYDLITAKTEQFSQEVRLSTSGQGPLQFTAGGNYTYYRNETDYYVFINALSAIAQIPGDIIGNRSADVNFCRRGGPPVRLGDRGSEGCIYIDPNPLASINGDGHNYFRSSNRYSLFSYGIFADGTYAVTPELKIIAGLRYNDDIKRTTPVPSQLLLSSDPILSGTVDRGYPADPDIRQHFRAVTGRAGLQWSPQTSFTDDTMIYATYSRGYKAGGTNPPPVGFSKVNPFDPTQPPFTQTLTYPPAFAPEYVNAFEVGMKNTLFNSRLTLNLTGYLYDYKDYQVSQVIDRSAINENFDARMYGVEFEALFKPDRQLTINANIGLQKTRIGKGETSVDVMDRTQGNPDYTIVKAFPILPSNCVVKKSEVEKVIRFFMDNGYTENSVGLLNICPGFLFSDTRIPADAFPNEGRGFYADVSGNEVPNAPRFTMNFGAEYAVPFGEWAVIPRFDVYHQSGSWARVYNTIVDRLHGWESVNFSLRIANPGKGLLIEAYVKNAFDTTPITDTFINSDDTGLTTNAFVFDPRTIGVNITKRF